MANSRLLGSYQNSSIIHGVVFKCRRERLVGLERSGGLETTQLHIYDDRRCLQCTPTLLNRNYLSPVGYLVLRVKNSRASSLSWVATSKTTEVSENRINPHPYPPRETVWPSFESQR